MSYIAVFCGSRLGTDSAFAEAAQLIGRGIGSRGLGTVYGGGHVGMMGTVADATLESGGPVIGVIPRSMVDKELAHEGCTELHIVDTMHERKTMMANRASAFIALPGGIGTFEEIFEAITWNQLAIHSKPVGFLNTGGFYNDLRRFMRSTVDRGFLPESTMDTLIFEDDPESLLDAVTHSLAGIGNETGLR